MPLLRLVAIVAVFMVLSFSAGLGSARVEPTDSQAPSLEDRVRQLEERVAAIEARLGTSGAPPAGSTDPPPAAPPTAFLVEYTFTEVSNSPGFNAQGQIEICWDITPPTSSFNMVFAEEGTQFTRAETYGPLAGASCRTLDVGRPGRFWLRVTAVGSSLRQGRLTVRQL